VGNHPSLPGVQFPGPPGGRETELTPIYPTRLLSWKHFLYGLLANMQEAQFSKTSWPELCPVLWSLPGGFLVVMPRA
jgi:hypothetical protein